MAKRAPARAPLTLQAVSPRGKSRPTFASGGSGGSAGARGPAGPPGASEDDARANVADYGADPAGAVDASDGIQTAADSGSAHLFFPAGTYRIDEGFDVSAADLTVTFAPGVTLVVSGESTGAVFSGARQRIVGGFTVSLAEASSETFTAVTVSGASSVIEDPYFTVTADVPNCTLLKLTGARSRAVRVALTGVGKTFKYAVHAVASGGTEVDCVHLDGLDVDVGDDGANATYGGLVYWRVQRGEIRDVEFDGGGRSLFPDGVVIIDGHNNSIHRPKIFASAATYGIYRVDGSEFLNIHGGKIQGRNNGTYQAGSEGIYCGDFAGHLKMFDVIISGWVAGVGIHGQHDTPVFTGCSIVNNQTYPLVIDGDAGAGTNGVRGVTLVGCYLSDQLGVGCIHFISGTIHGVSLVNCELGYQEIGFLVEPAVTVLEGMVISGGFIAGGLEGATPVAICQPSVNTAAGGILLVNPKLQTYGALGTGAYASKVIDLMASPTFGAVTATTLASATSTKTGTLGDAYLQENFTYFTANFGAGVGAGAAVELDFSWSEAIINRMFTWGLTGAAAASTSLLFFAYVKTNGTFTLRAYNPTGSPVGAVSSTIFVRSTKITL